VQIAALMLRFRCIGDVVIASSTRSARPAPPALGTLRRRPCGWLPSYGLHFLDRPAPCGAVGKFYSRSRRRIKGLPKISEEILTR